MRFLSRVGRLLFDMFGLEVRVRRPRPQWSADRSRFEYQQRYVEFNIQPGAHVLDVGNGGDPFPFATVLVDRFPGKSPSRYEPLVVRNTPFVMADIQDLPFGDKSFDFIHCAHVLEVINDPLKACAELMRVGKRGLIETPVAAKDLLFCWPKGLQKWHTVAINRTLCFFEYSDRQSEGIRSTAWRDLIFSPRHHELQDAFYDNQDVFNVLFQWEGPFSVYLFRLDGSVETLNTEQRESAGALVSQQ